MFYLFKIFIQISNTVLCSHLSISERDEELCNDWLINMRLTQHHPPVFYCHMLSLYNWIRCLQMNNHTSLFWQFLTASVDSQLYNKLELFGLWMLYVAWQYTTSTVLTYECSQNLDIDRRCLKLSKNVTWTYMVLQI